MIRAKASSYQAMAKGFDIKLFVIGKPNITAPIETYISGIKRTSDTTNLINNLTVGLSFSFFELFALSAL